METTQLKPTQLNAIGLNTEHAAELAKGLNELLPNYTVFYMNTRGFHWNVRGDKFFELHLKFEELYTDLLVKIDEVAERILTLGYTPLHTYQDFLDTSEVVVAKDVVSGYQGVEEILKAFRILLLKQRSLLNLSADAGDEGSNALMSDYIREQEKLVWMYSAFLNK